MRLYWQRYQPASQKNDDVIRNEHKINFVDNKVGSFVGVNMLSRQQ